MKNAKTVLSEIEGHNQAETPNQTATRDFVYIVGKAVNSNVSINAEQEDFLYRLISTHVCGKNEPSFIEAASVATWINSCR